jgi:hypothetical protein
MYDRDGGVDGKRKIRARKGAASDRISEKETSVALALMYKSLIGSNLGDEVRFGG